ncbi:dTDP-4-amino-4,6-dideoxygalactose transaminase [Algoriphagus confluentis]|uniref:dTDP-4-amino-4,6-dideoxygalactose transaminase n=1 Tax=Algoriphagus confluentis TaxID=1697556 RepID=A0ABQ6PPN7_9BACT|nr:dTDP-4-amino-4,6-dideoxygalactose transaminase [Algoriphagus confluentis]
MIPFNKPYITGKELDYIADAVGTGKISGNGKYTRLAQQFFEEKFGIRKALLTTSCTDALEMCALLLNISPGDEVIIPSYTFVSTANAFMLRGAKVVFADSRADHPGMDEDSIEELITPKTKAIVIVHYAGVACDMTKIMDLASKYNLAVVEDAAHAIDSYFLTPAGEKKPLGSIGHLATFSFHETKNISSGEGGLLAINDEKYVHRAEIIWEKGTNRASFFRGEINKYGWVDLGSSFLPSEVTAAFLWAQLENMSQIQQRRIEIWERYDQNLRGHVENYGIRLPEIPDFATNNGHMYYLIAEDGFQRDFLLKEMKSEGALAVFHYLSLHSSEYFASKHDGRELKNSDLYSDRLIRLPFFYELAIDEVDRIASKLTEILERYAFA